MKSSLKELAENITEHFKKHPQPRNRHEWRGFYRQTGMFKSVRPSYVYARSGELIKPRSGK